MPYSRRYFLQSLMGSFAVFSAGKFIGSAVAQETVLKLGNPRKFSFDDLKKRARDMAREIYISPAVPQREVTEKITYDEHRKIRFKKGLSLFADQESAHPVQLFHLGSYFQKKVIINIVEDGEAREIFYLDDYFEMPDESPAHQLKTNAGFAGFRFHETNTQTDWSFHDWAAFLGASYFRAIGDTKQYGLSARGLAVNVTIAGKPEEFPDFREFWIEAPREESGESIVYALLDSPSVCGVYRFVLSRSDTVLMDVEKHIYLRKTVDQLGIAPMSSMYWFSETRKPFLADWRPEVHDSDGLKIRTGKDEVLWRPLNNPSKVMTSAFIDEAPRGFGLMQRDRNFDHYLDGVYYERRPSLWIEPTNSWGKGSVQLVEIPTNMEVHDNIVAMWVPEEKAKAGQHFEFRYKMHWHGSDIENITAASVVATRLSQGGLPGIDFPTKDRKFMIEFKGQSLENLPRGAKPEQIVSVSRGKITHAGGIEPIRADPSTPWDHPSAHWRTYFDLQVEGPEPVELRCFLKFGDNVLTETWAYQYHPVNN